MMLRVIPHPAQADNPKPLIKKTLFLNRAKGIYLRIALLTADNKDLPYLLVQIYENPEKPKYILNYAFFLDPSVFNRIRSGELSSSDFIIGGLNKAHVDGIKAYNVLNGKDFTDALFNNQLSLNKFICDDIDLAIKHWDGKKEKSNERPS